MKTSGWSACLCLLTIVAVFFIVPASARADTVVSGVITSDTTWDASGGTYIVSDSIRVFTGATLTIEPGTVVKVGRAKEIVVDGGGVLNINGTAADPVYITSIYDDTVGGDTNGDATSTIPTIGNNWYGIEVKAGSSANIEHAVIRYGSQAYSDVYVTGGILTVSDSEFSDAYHYGIRQSGGTTTVNGTTFKNNTVGIDVDGGRLSFNNNIFEDNSFAAVEIADPNALVFHSGNIATSTQPTYFNGIVMNGTLYNDSTWTVDDMPYVVAGRLLVSSGATLTIEPGVVVKADWESNSFVVVGDNGELNVNGTAESPVYFTSLKDDTVGGDTNSDGPSSVPVAGDWYGISVRADSVATFSHAVVRYGGGNYPDANLSNLSGTLTVSNSEIYDSERYGIYAYGGTTTVSGTEIKDNEYGYYLVTRNPLAVGSDIFHPTKSIFYGNNVHGNSAYGMYNAIDGEVIVAENNYWGDPTGPYHPTLNPNGLGDSVSDGVDFEPWLEQDAGIGGWPTCTEDCYSNVLFLPGLKGSELELKDGSDVLWPPTILSNDVPQLALTENGESVNDVVVDGVISSAYGTSVYGGFSDFMDSLVAGGTINEWKPLPYDWRYSPEQVVENGVETPSGHIDMVKQVEELAANSKSGKVTIIAHSMGGLVGKALIKRLEDEGKADLVDSFVMVAVPQLGTPQAIGGLLHGSRESIGWGIVVNPAVIRTVAQDMPGPYSLLPSERYFEEVESPPVVFDPNASFTEEWRVYWENTLDSFTELEEFLKGLGVPRPDPPENDLHAPTVLRTDLVDGASSFHNEFDNYTFPAGMHTVQVVGWGLDTIKDIEYTTRHLMPSYEPQFTVEGDETVVYPSANSSDTDETYYFDLHDYNNLNNKQNFQHFNILNSYPTQEVISSIVEDHSIPVGDFISITKPPVENIDDQLVVSTHSPVILGVHDGQGNFTGIDPNQELSAEILKVDEEIPGSSFHAVGDSQYIFVPKQGSYIFEFKGVGEGSTTVEVEDFANDVTTPIVAYTDIPVTANTSATFVVDSTTPVETEIEVDQNSDGEVDETVQPDGAEGTQMTLEEIIAAFKAKIEDSNINRWLKALLVRQLEKLEKRISKLREEKPEVITHLEEVLAKWHKKHLNFFSALQMLREAEDKI